MQFKYSNPVKIVPHKVTWKQEFISLATKLRSVAGHTALRIDHIGSTSVSNLAAKDIIDIQITLCDLTKADAFVESMLKAKYKMQGDIRYDCLVGYEDDKSDQLKKLYFREPDGTRRTHIHIRQMGNLNQKYPLMFRDYLRTQTPVKDSYELIKFRLAELYPEQIEGYLHIKDPLMDIIFHGAQIWAEKSNWQMDSEYF